MSATDQSNNGDTDKARALRVAIIGSGPSGFYAAEALLKDKTTDVQVDILDRLPTPFGLVRGGVAPDHQKIKSVTKVYERIASDERLRFFGNVMLGRDLNVADLRRYYDAVIYATGCESDRNLGIPGEELAGSHAATEFVGWYNGHPDHRDKKFDLSCERVAVVGIGNVAIDVTRILAKSPDDLAETDIAGYALDALRSSSVKEVLLLGRRGPGQAAFAPKEIEELDELRGCRLVIRPDEGELDPVSKAEFDKGADAKVKKNVEKIAEVAARPDEDSERKIRLRLCVSPVEIIGENGRITAVRLEKNKLQADDNGRIRPKGTGEYETIEVGMVLRSVGYYGVPIPDVPFDKKRGTIANSDGRVVDAETQKTHSGEYVVGWAKRGPSGLIGTNRADSYATVEALLSDFKGVQLPESEDRTPEAAQRMLEERQSKLVRFEDWKRLDQLENERGQAKGKIREKFCAVEEMLAALDAGASVS